MSRGKKYECDGVDFDSKLEREHYKLLRDSDKINILEIHKKFILLNGFDWVSFPDMKKRKYRPMVYTPDFIVEIKGCDKPVAIESKGYPRKDYNIRKKLFIKELGTEYYFWEIGSVKELKEWLSE